jgi:hypothetical protein
MNVFRAGLSFRREEKMTSAGEETERTSQLVWGVLKEELTFHKH